VTPERSILLVHPPFICPAEAPYLLATAAASLRAAGASVSVYNANQDFLPNHLLDTSFAQDCLDMVLSKADRGVYQELGDPFLAEQLQDINLNQALWRERCAKGHEIVEVMAGERFYDPAALVSARGQLDAALALASLAYFPLRLHWNGLYHPDAQSWDAAQAFSKDHDNPFHLLAERFKEACQNAQALVFCIGCRDQLLPAFSLLRIINEEQSEPEAVFWGPGLKDVDPPQGVAWLAGGDPAALCAALDLSDPGQQPPDYNGLGACLAPELVTGVARHYKMTETPSLEELKEHNSAGVVIAFWPVEPGAGIEELAKTLRAASKAGMWNRVELAAGVGAEIEVWCAANPNLAHSVIKERQREPGLCGPVPEPWPEEPAVGTLPPMAGRPLWRWLDGDQHLALYIRQHGLRQIRIQRVREDLSVYTLGQEVDYHFVHYPDLKDWHIESILKLITFAGKVKPDWLKYNLERSYLVAYALEEGMMAATETLKHPRPEYIRKVRERTGLDFSKHLERGYIVVRPEYRGLGIGDHLIKGCLARAPGYKTFLAIGAENKVAQQLTARHGSRFVTRYFSEEMGKEIEIWTPKDQDDLPETGEAQCK
jgi:GNAT superfamily N-acetyltransferase